MKRIAWVFLTLAAGLSAVSCGSREEQTNPAAPATPAAGASSGAEGTAEAQAVRMSRMTWFFIDGCDDARAVRWKLYDGTDNYKTTFPATGVWKVPSLGRSQRTITCRTGDKICFGAAVDIPGGGTQWGVGVDAQFRAVTAPNKGACFGCNNYTIGGRLVCRFRKSGLTALGDGLDFGAAELEAIE